MSKVERSESSEVGLAVIGGGAAGYFGALRAAACAEGEQIVIFEAGKRPLEKVRISGGGRCNVTHHCFEAADFARNYPRGSKELRAAFHRFQAKDTWEWFESRGVQLKAERDGRVFPVSDDSASIIDCLEHEREKRSVRLRLHSKITSIERGPEGEFLIEATEGSSGSPRKYRARALLLATGSSRSGYGFAELFGHSISPLAPSLFTFTVPDEELRALSGVAAPLVALALVIDGRVVAKHEGPLLVTHWGLSGPAVLKLSAWAARELLASHYVAVVRVDWTHGEHIDEVKQCIAAQREETRKFIIRTPLYDLPTRLWEFLVRRSIPSEAERPWSQLSRAASERLAGALTRFELPIAGKGQFKEEFVTCGGVTLSEVDFRTMESKRMPGLYFAGELLDVDGITGGFNFQNAWTTGWIAGTAIGERLSHSSIE